MLFLNKFDIFEKKVLDVRQTEESILICASKTFGFNKCFFIGSVECLRVVQRLPTSFEWETRD